MIHTTSKKVNSELSNFTLDTLFSSLYGEQALPGDPKKKPELEPGQTPNEDPGEAGGPDDDDFNPLYEPSIGDDPGTEETKIPIM
ncbi:hypothetical protein EXU57_06595 [Segetibacter sp. 3557_3]|uniref:hypothetical protein n=1 Tax=Segetibacter sp. 3557_3 TaxID=2547429 RepID=UPI001058D69C|nr:hypothetical protein [Segetibacter sp. 3557_3]TDH27253.1 hypothetical protein EXU57_06595 [Segetibacter sp. 3557_3]